ncbi:hypothetical protein, partial [Kordia sp.]|uniref:hypothetical protein n=1 Tax=Kordia sp. TaxID=1965332 RepID=UPI003D6A6C52
MKLVSQAKKLIKECLESQTTYLDLGNCGITNLGDIPELFECTHIETLILSNKWYDTTKKKMVYSKNQGQLNTISYITKDIVTLKNLRNLKIGGEYHFFNLMFFRNTFLIQDIHLLKDLKGLTSLDLSHNQISDI